LTGTPSPWSARIAVLRPSPESAERLYRALLPEAAREVPRAHAVLRPVDGSSVVLDVEANDTGALRAAVNTYLGWIHLADRTEEVAGSASLPVRDG